MTGIPALILLTHLGDVYANVLLEPSLAGPEAFFAVADAHLENGKKLATLRKKADSAKGVERAKGLDAFLEALAPGQREKYGEMIREIPTLDADGGARSSAAHLSGPTSVGPSSSIPAQSSLSRNSRTASPSPTMRASFTAGISPASERSASSRSM